MHEFTVELQPEGDASHFHTSNGPNEDFRQIILRTPNDSSSLSMKGKILEVHHGEMLYQGRVSAATLVVFDFCFLSRVREHRYHFIKLHLEFFDKSGKRSRDPAVVKVAPNRLQYLHKTKHIRTTTHSASVGIKAGLEVAGLEAGAKWSVQQSKPVNFSAYLTGTSGVSAGKNGDDNTVTWSMQENNDAKLGVPSYLQTAVLLRRSHQAPFYATLGVRSEVDLVSTLRRALPFTTDRDTIIDPVTFTPTKVQVHDNMTTGIRQEQLQHMEQLELTKYSKVDPVDEDSSLTPSLTLPPEAGTQYGIVAANTAAD